MKVKKKYILLTIAAVIVLLCAILLSVKNHNLKKNKIEILDATFKCDNNYEVFYEDSENIYSFMCTQSKSTFVLFPNGNKVLLVDALNNEEVTIEEVIEAGLKVHIDKKWGMIYG